MTHEELLLRSPEWLPDGRVRARGVTIYQSHKCDFCGKECWATSSDLRRRGTGFCDTKCVQGWRTKMSREGRRDGANGYALVRRPEHPNAMKNGYVLEHRYVMAELIGRPLEPHEVVHHKDGNRNNNAIENLELIASNAEHQRLHGLLGDLATLTRYGVRNCTKCGEVKPLTEFARSTRELHGHISWCRPCRHDHYIATNPQRQRATDALKARHKQRWEASEDYKLVQAGQRRCKTCNEVRPLTQFSHHPHCMAGHAYYCKSCDFERRKKAGYSKKLKNPR